MKYMNTSRGLAGGASSSSRGTSPGSPPAAQVFADSAQRSSALGA
jgi:hypothetical protein